MEFSEGSSSEILGRLSSAYGVETQKQLAEKLGVSAANVSNWVQRNSVPGSAFVRCALDTGCDLAWLATGKFVNANINPASRIKSYELESGKELIKSMLSTGGRAVLQRVMKAYGFKTQKELSDYLDISTGTISTWVRRGYFPGDVVIACALETGVSLLWLATGNQLSRKNTTSAIDLRYVELPHFIIKNGHLVESGVLIFDPYLINGGTNNINFVEYEDGVLLVDFKENVIGNGKWLLDIEGIKDIYIVTRIPNGRIKVSRGEVDFECSIHEVICLGKVIKTMVNN